MFAFNIRVLSCTEMLQLDGYQLQTCIYSSPNSLVYRGFRQPDNHPIILKVLKQEHPLHAERIHYRQEYDITRMLNLQSESEGVINAYALEEVQGRLAIVLEDFGGISLAQAMQSALGQVSPFSLDDFLTIAVQITEILGDIHQAHVIHKDINLTNILIHPQTKQIKLIDFGISTVLSRENPRIQSPTILEGTLAYISPEQTGRMNRVLDYRTDFYSLGVSFYELLTGSVPFKATDPLELVHCHIACQAAPVNHVNPAIPPIIAQIVTKLMAKTAEERYQSAWGIKADLEHCLHQLQTSDRIQSFPLGCRDIASTLQIPQTLYGREQDVKCLLEAFTRVASSSLPPSELMLVAGYSGIGKSALVQELYKPITRSRGYFIAGKFDQFQRNIPYSAIADAFQGLVRQLLTEPEERLDRWRDRLLAAVGNNGQVIVDVIPDLELIIGPQPPLPELGSAERQNRFNLAFQAVVQVLSAPDHPLVLFLDDLQWVDAATLNLMDLILMDANTRNLLVIGAYRDNEVDQAHPLSMALFQWRQQGAAIHQITLMPLKIEHVTQLIADTLQQDCRQIRPLSQLVMQKTRGNPFFVNEFLRALHADALLVFNRTTLRWQWDMGHIEQQEMTDNVVDLMVSKIKKLSPSTQEMLQIAACIGTKFNLTEICGICQKPSSTVFQDIKPALALGLINPMSGLNEELLIQSYKFGHDRIQQAAYTLLDERQRQEIHFNIGTMLLQQVMERKTDDELIEQDPSASISLGAIPSRRNPKKEFDNSTSNQKLPITKRSNHYQDENVFSIVNQLNMGIALVRQQPQKDELARLNFEVGQKAKQSTAYEGAIAYFKTGLSLLGNQPWQTHYDLSLRFHQELAATYYSMGHFQAMNTAIHDVLNHGQSLLDKVVVYAVSVQAYLAQGQFQQAVTTAIEVSNLLGISVSETDLNDPLGQVETINMALGARSPADLVHLPMMDQAQAQAALKILSSANSAAYVGVPAYLPSIVSKQVQLLIDHGNSPLSAFVYAWYGTLLCGAFLDIETGYEFGQLALAMLTRHQTIDIRPKTTFIVNCMIVHWKQHVRDTLEPLLSAYQDGRDVGDVEYASWAILVRCEHSFCMGKSLVLLEQDMQVSAETIGQFKQDSALFHNNIFHQATLNLLGKSPVPYHLSGSRFNDDILADFKQRQQEKTGVFHAHLCQLQLAYLFGRYEEAIAYANAAQPYVGSAAGLFAIVPFYLYDSLAHLAIYTDASPSEQQAIAERVAGNQAKMKQWATHAPENHQHKYDLVQAEWCRVQGRQLDAIAFYDQAIASANANAYVHEQALACERAAQFYIRWGKEKFAQIFLQDAHRCYQQWGAHAMVQHLKTQYPRQLFHSNSNAYAPNASRQQITAGGGTQTGLSASLDIMTVLKASQAISSEIVLEKLLEKLIRFAIENAGAESGVLALTTDNGFSIEAMGTANQVDTTLSQPLSQSQPYSQAQPLSPSQITLPVAIVQYVQRTRKAVVLTNATQDTSFRTDPYIVAKQPKSLLCAPILDRGKMLGLIYLENNLIPGAFTRDRLEILSILSAQAAISLDNALLYRTLETKVAERTTQLAAANQEITALNQRLEAENLRLSAELAITQKLQQMMLPKATELEGIADLDIAGFMAPADEVGGDYYDVLPYGPKNDHQGIKIGIGDVTGHGLESGVLMLMVQTAVRTLQESQEADPIRFLDIINRTLYKNIERMGADKNLTLAVLDYADGQLRLSGQHEELIVVRTDGLIERFDTIDLGFPIGLDMDIASFIAQQTVPLEVGDVAVLYTDGITEAENRQHELYGIDRLCTLVSQHAHCSAANIRQAVIADVHAHINNHTIFDDITLLVLKRK